MPETYTQSSRLLGTSRLLKAYAVRASKAEMQRFSRCPRVRESSAANPTQERGKHLGVAVENIRHGGKPLDATLAYMDSCREVHPELHKVFDLYAAIFTVQRRFYDGFVPGPPGGPPDAVSGGPALVGMVPGVELSNVQEALAEIAGTITAAAPERQSELESLSNLWGYAQDDVGRLLDSPDSPGGPDSSVTRTIFLLALNPFYEKAAVGIVPSVADVAWQFGYCPVCGERPSVAKYDETSGTRFLQCGLCRTQWTRGRVLCAFCGNADQDKLGYLSDAPDSPLRAEVCDVCRRYIKAVDERALGREVILHVEELTMTSLDREALSKGYQP